MKSKLLLLFFTSSFFAQGYTSFFTGNTTNITTSPLAGTCLMGGATENDNAMKWLLQRANGGDVVVLRTSGGSGYNNYFFSQLGIAVNSVETLLITSAAGAVNPYVLDKVSKAEMIWFAGGDQANYVNFFKDNAMEDVLNAHVNEKQAPIGGTSAGMAILCGRYFSAINGSVTSAQALANPYASNITLGTNDFLSLPFLSNVTTDTHFDSPDRRGRLTTFLARRTTDSGLVSYGIACNEYTAVCIDAAGNARVFGDFPNYQEFAYFVQTNCVVPFVPENCSSGSSLTWNRNNEALKVYKVAGTQTGVNTFNVSNFMSGTGGSWENWTANNGVFASTAGMPIVCLLNTNTFNKDDFKVYPNPAENELYVEGVENAELLILNMQGQIVLKIQLNSDKKIDVSNLKSGMYMLNIIGAKSSLTYKILKK